MNVMLLAKHLDTGGITTYVLTLAKGLIAAGDKVWVVSCGGEHEEALKRSGVCHRRLDIRVKSEAHPKIWMAIPALVKMVKEQRIDCLHAQTRTTTIMAALVSWLTGVPYVTTCHGFFKPRLFRLIFPCWGKTVIAISVPVKEHLEYGFNVDPKRIKLVSNGIDITRFVPLDPGRREVLRQEKGITGDPVIGTIARLSPVKGLDVLVAAMPRVLQVYPKAVLWIVGTGDQEGYLKECAKKRGLNEGVKFLGVVDQTDVLLPLFDVFVMPSLQEGLGLSVMEAQACGVPVVASKVGGLVELVEDEKTGRSVPPRDHAALAEAIIGTLKDPAGALAMAQSARQRIVSSYSAETMVNQTRQCYEAHLRR